MWWKFIIINFTLCALIIAVRHFRGFDLKGKDLIMYVVVSMFSVVGTVIIVIINCCVFYNKIKDKTFLKGRKKG